MKKIALVSFFLFALFAGLSAQTSSSSADTIYIKEGAYYSQNQLLSAIMLEKMIETDTAAYRVYKQALGPKVIAYTFSYIGGFCVGFPIGMALSGASDVPWALVGVGAVCIGVSIPIAISAGKKVKRSIQIYNNHKRGIAYNESPAKVRLNISPGGLGLCLNF